MNITKFEYFYEVAKLQHMTKAASKLHVAQPALTQSIHSLEKELDVKLFDKRGRNIYLTEYGAYLKSKLDIIIPEIESIPTEIEYLKGKINKTIKLNIMAASTFVINTIVEYRKKRPDSIIEFEQTELTHDCDIRIMTKGMIERAKHPGDRRCIVKEQIFLAVPIDSEYAAGNTIDLGELKQERFVMLSGSRHFRQVCDSFCEQVGFSPQVLFESDSPIAVQNIISTGSGIAFWPEFSWGQPTNQNIKLLPIVQPDCKRELVIDLYNRSRKSEYAEDFYGYLIEVLGKFESET